MELRYGTKTRTKLMEVWRNTSAKRDTAVDLNIGYLGDALLGWANRNAPIEVLREKLREYKKNYDYIDRRYDKRTKISTDDYTEELYD